MTALASMPAARRRIWEAGLRAGIVDPEAVGRPAPALPLPRSMPAAVRRPVVAQDQESPASPPPVDVIEGAVAERAIECMEQAAQCRSRPMAAILAAVAAKHGVTVAEILGRRRLGYIARARQEVMYRAVIEGNLSYPAIGRQLGRDHSSVHHGVREHARRRRLPVPSRGEVDQ